MPDLSKFKEFNKIDTYPEKTNRGLEYKKSKIGINLESIDGYYYESETSCRVIIGNNDFRIDVSFDELKALIEEINKPKDGKPTD